jgi:Cytochrome c554 and c-prime
VDASESPAIEPDRPRAPAAWEAPAIAGVFLAILGGGFWWATSTPPRVAQYSGFEKGGVDPDYPRFVGDAACAGCHPGEAAAHGRSGHARTLRPSARSPMAREVAGKRIEDPERPGVTWGFSFLDGKLIAERSEGDKVERSPVDYAFGSGHHATTFLTLLDRSPTHPVALEHRISYYGHSKSLGLTPGQSLSGHAVGKSPTGMVHSSSLTLRCFECHATAISDRGSKVLDEATMIPNVSCERCHGPGRSHVEAARSGASADALRMPQGPGRWTAREQLEQCGQCHRTPEMVNPGSIRVDNPSMVRHQPVGLIQSACYLKSRGDLSCVTCHDPHSKTSTDRAGYETTCLSCHQQAQQKVCTVSPRSGCLDCHMPKREVTRGMTMTDHWIRRSRGQEGPTSSAAIPVPGATGGADGPPTRAVP